MPNKRDRKTPKIRSGEQRMGIPRDSEDRTHPEQGRSGYDRMPKPGFPPGKDDGGERSDRDSGRPIQLYDGHDVETGGSGRADAEPGIGGRRQQGGEERRVPEDQSLPR
jgi:hypothetical protein